MGKLVMAYWDCPFCGAQGNRGDVVNCPSCGRARGEVKFYMKDHSEGTTRKESDRGDVEYLSEEQAKYVSRNPDWYCSFCNSLNSDNAPTCLSCGASRESSESNYFEMLKKKEERDKMKAPPQPTAQQAQAAAPKSSKKWLVIAAIVVMAIVGVFIFLNSNKTTGDLKVTALNWQRNIQIEENIQYSESGWDLPRGAEVTSQKREIHHYDQVLDHYENVEVQRSRQVVDHYDTEYDYKDLGNGTYEEVSRRVPVYKTEYYTETVREPRYRPEPRYATKYYYTIWRWTPTRVCSISGDDHNAAWPEVTLKENEREGEHSESYRITVENEKNNTSTTYQLSEADWQKIHVDDMLFITAKRTGANAYISDEKGNKIAEITPVK